MNLAFNRLDPSVPDPVESRRRAAGRLVRILYSTAVFGALAFLVVYFGAPLVFLGGPGIVSSPRHVVSLPYVVQVNRMSVVAGDEVKAGTEVGQVWSPEQDGIVATYMRALAELTGREAELRVKARVAQDSLDAARTYMRLTEEAANRIESGELSVVSLSYRLEIFRERAAARKAVVSQEAEVAEATVQLEALGKLSQDLRGRREEVERNYARGRVSAPVAGIVSTTHAHVGQSLVAGTPIAEILDPADVFVDWYVPNERLFDPKVGNRVFVLFGNRRIPGRVSEILRVSDVYAGSQQSLVRDRTATQIARIRFSPGASSAPLNATVHIHMYYTDLAARAAARLVDLLGLH